MLHATISPDDPRALYVQIMDEVRRAIAIGALSADDPLPSVRQLSAHLRVTPNTVALAYRELEREGVVYVRRGQGTFVSPDAGVSGAQRQRVADDAAKRALVDAHRNGVSVEELISALRRATGARETAEREVR